jgi:uncharacterized membrane protein YdjX (TVP38/TMEM64 family)
MSFAQGTTAYNLAAYVTICFTGCTPGTIGTLYVSSAMSFKPQAGSTGIYDVRVRGSYQGTHRWLHQLRKANKQV